MNEMKKKTTGSTRFFQILLGAKHAETAVITTRPSQIQATRETAVSRPYAPTPTPIIEQPVFSEMQSMQIASMLANLIGSGLHQFQVKERCGRVYLISYVPLDRVDPLLPFVFRDYGFSYRRQYGVLTDMLTRWNHVTLFWDYRKAEKAAKVLINFVCSDPDLTSAEKTYYQVRMMYAISMPQYAR